MTDERTEVEIFKARLDALTSQWASHPHFDHGWSDRPAARFASQILHAAAGEPIVFVQFGPLGLRDAAEPVRVAAYTEHFIIRAESSGESEWAMVETLARSELRSVRVATVPDVLIDQHDPIQSQRLSLEARYSGGATILLNSERGRVSEAEWEAFAPTLYADLLK